MSYIVYQTNKNTGQKYAYECESYKDPATSKQKIKRTYLGKVDAVSGEIIPKGTAGKRNTQRTAFDVTEFVEKQQAEKEEDREKIVELTRKVEELIKEQEQIRRFINGMTMLLTDCQEIREEVPEKSK